MVKKEIYKKNISMYVEKEKVHVDICISHVLNINWVMLIVEN